MSKCKICKNPTCDGKRYKVAAGSSETYDGVIIVCTSMTKINEDGRRVYTLFNEDGNGWDVWAIPIFIEGMFL
jgi:hypothetical protein